MALKYIKAETNYYIEYDDVAHTAKVINKEEAAKELAFNQTQLSSLPATPADKELLAWAKANYPRVEGIETSKQLITSNIEKLQTQLAEMK